MKKYWTIFKVSWQRQLEYRFNFLLGRLRNIMVLLLFYYLWRQLAYGAGNFAGYAENELITYVFLANILRSIVFGGQSREIAQAINRGNLSAFLIKPINFFAYNFAKEAGERTVLFISSLLEVFIFAILLKADLIWQNRLEPLLLFLLACFLAMILYSLLGFSISLTAFWSREAMGPRFLFEWLLEFASGSFFPLNILGDAAFAVLSALPFMYLIYFPLEIYLGRLSGAQAAAGIAAQIALIAFFGFAAAKIWKNGLKKFSGEGI